MLQNVHNSVLKYTFIDRVRLVSNYWCLLVLTSIFTGNQLLCRFSSSRRRDCHASAVIFVTRKNIPRSLFMRVLMARFFKLFYFLQFFCKLFTLECAAIPSPRTAHRIRGTCSVCQLFTFCKQFTLVNLFFARLTHFQK